MDETWIGTTDAARVANVSEATIRQWGDMGFIKGMRRYGSKNVRLFPFDAVVEAAKNRAEIEEQLRKLRVWVPPHERRRQAEEVMAGASRILDAYSKVSV